MWLSVWIHPTGSDESGRDGLECRPVDQFFPNPSPRKPEKGNIDNVFLNVVTVVMTVIILVMVMLINETNFPQDFKLNFTISDSQ